MNAGIGLQDINIQDILKFAVKPDLNCIYTEPLHDVEGGLDFGWFCKEHALHAHILMNLLGVPSKLVIGDIGVRYENMVYSTLDDPADHAWCLIGNKQPLDLSVTFNLARTPRL